MNQFNKFHFPCAFPPFTPGATGPTGVAPWFKKNYTKVSGALPHTVQSMLSSMSGITSSQFAVAVGISFKFEREVR